MNERPQSLHEVASRAETLAHFGREFADWLHTLRTLPSRPQIAQAMFDEPPSLRARFPEGEIADAWLAAYAEHLAGQLGLSAPAWTQSPSRIATNPWFSTDLPSARARLLRDSPPAFKRRNVFTDAVDLPLRLRAGRPPKTAEEKRLANAARQRRFRARRALELELLQQSLRQL
jgi:hypothetical protein